jgi:UDP:flavonoid glycosyltransferase YjiC (YdhE family)
MVDNLETLLQNGTRRIRALRPDLALVDSSFTLPFALPYLESSVPILAVSTTFAAELNLSIPPCFYNRIPGGGLLHDRLINGPLWARTFARHLGRSAWREAMLLALEPKWFLHRPQKRIQKLGCQLRFGEYGFKVDLPETILAPRSLDFPSVAATRRAGYVGACVDFSREDGNLDLDRIDLARPLVYCSLGTFAGRYRSAKRLFFAMVDYFRARSDHFVVIQGGGSFSAADVHDLPRHIEIVDFVPQLECLRRACVFVTQGGPSSVRESAVLGVPMIVYPCWFDQPGNAARVRYHGIGVVGDIHTVTPMSFGRLFEEVAVNRSYRDAAARMRSLLESEIDCSPGVELVEAMLPSPQS